MGTQLIQSKSPYSSDVFERQEHLRWEMLWVTVWHEISQYLHTQTEYNCCLIALEGYMNLTTLDGNEMNCVVLNVLQDSVIISIQICPYMNHHRQNEHCKLYVAILFWSLVATCFIISFSDMYKNMNIFKILCWFDYMSLPMFVIVVHVTYSLPSVHVMIIIFPLNPPQREVARVVESAGGS
jgi:hypothetical protein